MTLACSSFFFFNDPATTEIYTLSLHDALPIQVSTGLTTAQTAVLTTAQLAGLNTRTVTALTTDQLSNLDRKSTRLNSSHVRISYAVFCLKKKKKKTHKSLQKKQKTRKQITRIR